LYGPVLKEVRNGMGRARYDRQGALVEDLMDFHARLIERHREDREQLRRLTARALWMEATLRKDGNPAEAARLLELVSMPNDDADTSSVAS
jgi:hypothetical protein